MHLTAKSSLTYQRAASKVLTVFYNNTKHLSYQLTQWHDTHGPDHSSTSFYSVHRQSLPTTKERRHIAFLKVHKAASSTAQNIFLRFAKKRDLLVVLPLVPKFFYPNVISITESVTEQNILPVPGDRFYEILCCHVKYNKAAFARIMPPDTVNIGIVRDPFDHFISTLNYMRPVEVFKINTSDPVSAFLEDPTNYLKRTTMGFINNWMAFEFDFPADLFETRDANGIEQYLHKLNSEFQLVLIVEMFDESLVLMRRFLNWGMKDILYVKLNSKGKVFERITFKPGDVHLYKKWGELDYALYRFFFRRIQVQIQEQGQTFYDELLYYRVIRKDMEIFCEGNLTSNATYLVPASSWSDVFEITKEDCANMKKREIPFIKEIRMQQYGFFNDTIKPG
ncbi:galactose-3-O-sulfotransferase 3-like isoform X2 [Mizuhopecten yessoensis]|uniref:Galactose-3-O-sulfotransferase 3 n=2 Tax=Mizuhopecten yessoensis TaxID=6573 RepID=A0A210PQ41_MIZYE|nr:galactose-3-O-sulfotransferase 3-like isoform X2 [Mizuhopecten yessoensis]OWF38598.1 Galactose-3-O-sulfotransferase 3 [Mizuhopecten yessoensis]